MTPYAPTGNRHQDVESGPYRREDPIRRIEGWFVERLIPGVDARHRDGAADGGDREAQDYENDEAKDIPSGLEIRCGVPAHSHSISFDRANHRHPTVLVAVQNE